MSDSTTIVLIIALAAFLYMVQTGAISSDLPGTNIDINVEGGSDGTDGTDGVDTTDIDICGTLTTNYPAYMAARELSCGAAAGTWVCGDDASGCYDIPVWNNTLCNTNSELQALKAFCTTIGADWTCTATEISCEK